MRCWRLPLAVAVVMAWAAPGQAREGRGALAAERVVLHTSQGPLVLALYPEVAPGHVAQFLRLVRLGVYDSTHFYRVHAGFLIQVSDATDRARPFTPEQRAAIHPLPAEFSHLRHRRGIVSMARYDGHPNSATTSFVILLGDAPHLDGQYTIFGELVQGEEALSAISRSPVDEQHRPRERIEILRAEVTEGDVDGAVPVGARDPAAATEASTAAWSLPPPLWPSILLMVGGLCTFLAARFATPQVAGSVGLLSALTGFFVCVLQAWPAVKSTPWGPAAVFGGMLVMFKLMAFFETGRPPRSR